MVLPSWSRSCQGLGTCYKSRRLSSDSHMCAEAYSGHVYQSINKHNKILKFKKTEIRFDLNRVSEKVCSPRTVVESKGRRLSQLVGACMKGTAQPVSSLPLFQPSKISCYPILALGVNIPSPYLNFCCQGKPLKAHAGYRSYDPPYKSPVIINLFVIVAQ